MHVLALDESGIHPGAKVMLVAGLAVHEADARRLERALHTVVVDNLAGLPGLDAHAHELHAADLKTPRKGKPASAGFPPTRDSEWLTVSGERRLKIMADAYRVLREFEPSDPELPVRVFGAVVERSHKEFKTAERYVYDHVLHRFDEMLRRFSKERGTPERGVVLHDRSPDREKAIQQMAAGWQRTGARLEALVQLPLFVDSRASRLVQAADFVSHAIGRAYAASDPDDSLAKDLWPLVDIGSEGELSGVIHLTPEFGRCPCTPCQSRRTKPAAK